jgi:hypothetical protein
MEIFYFGFLAITVLAIIAFYFSPFDLKIDEEED